MPDFSSLLSKPADEIKAPIALPEGSFNGVIQKYEFREVDTPNDRENPKKPIVSLTVKLTEPLDDVDEADLNEALDGEPLASKAPMKYDFWLTNDAQYRVIEFAKTLGISVEGQTLGGIIQEFPNQAVIAQLAKVPNKKREGEYFTNIVALAGTVEVEA